MATPTGTGGLVTRSDVQSITLKQRSPLQNKKRKQLVEHFLVIIVDRKEELLQKDRVENRFGGKNTSSRRVEGERLYGSKLNFLLFVVERLQKDEN